MSGALDGLRVVELCDEKGALAGKLLADMGADVIKVEPPSGDATRGYAPFYRDDADAEHSLWFWSYNTSKRGVTLNLEQERGREIFRDLVREADIVVESQRPGEMARLGLDYAELRDANPSMIWVAITPFGRDGPRSDEEASDMTVLAGGGPVWMNGYDDHSLPPVRGGGNQGYHTGCHYAVMALLTALVYRDVSGEGQFIDVNMHAAANVTTERGSMGWLVAQETMQRQTGRHADKRPSMPIQVRCADGGYVNTGVPPRRNREFRTLYDWLVTLGLEEQLAAAPIVLAAAEGDEIHLSHLGDDPDAAAKFAAAREAVNLIAETLPAYEFFMGGQERGFQFGIINAPEEMIEDPHFKARGFPVDVEHPELGASFVYPGAPYRFEKTPWRIRRRAPLLGEDNAEVYGELGLSAEQIAGLQADGVV